MFNEIFTWYWLLNSSLLDVPGKYGRILGGVHSCKVSQGILTKKGWFLIDGYPLVSLEPKRWDGSRT